MRRARVTLTPAAERDLEDIAAYVAEQAGERTALTLVRKLRAQAGRLRETPYLGPEDDRLGGRRRIVVRPYLVVYKIVAPNDVRVLRFVHSARDLPSIFSRSDES